MLSSSLWKSSNLSAYFAMKAFCNEGLTLGSGLPIRVISSSVNWAFAAPTGFELAVADFTLLAFILIMVRTWENIQKSLLFITSINSKNKWQCSPSHPHLILINKGQFSFIIHFYIIFSPSNSDHYYHYLLRPSIFLTQLVNFFISPHSIFDLSTIYIHLLSVYYGVSPSILSSCIF